MLVGDFIVEESEPCLSQLLYECSIHYKNVEEDDYA